MALFSGNVYSKELRQTTHLNVIVPDESEDFWPVIEGDPRVLYLLHGLGANCDEWVRFSKIEAYAKLYDLVIVMPEVHRSFYLDTAIGPRYLSYVADELPHLVGEWFRIPSDREHTFVAGESMGGYGAALVASRHPERFSGVALLSAVTEPQGVLGQGGLLDWGDGCAEERAFFGPEGATTEKSLSGIVPTLTRAAEPVRIYQACGQEDSLLGQSLRLAARLDELGADRLLETWPGGHDFLFWDVAIERAIRWFAGLEMETLG